MKKFIKVCLIMAVVCLLLGTGFTAVAGISGAGLRDLPIFIYGNHRYNWNKMDQWNGHKDWDAAEGKWDGAKEEWNAAKEEWDGAEAEWVEYWNRDIDLVETQTFANVKNLALDVDAAGIELILVTPASEEEKHQIQVRVGSGRGTYRINMVGEELHVESHFEKGRMFKDWDGGERRIQIWIPEGYEFDKVDMEINAGVVTADHLLANELRADMAVGDVEIQGGNVKKLEGSFDVGNFSYEGTISKEADVECMVGVVSLDLTGSKTDYNYEVAGSLTSVTIDGEGVFALGRHELQNKDAVRKMDINCQLGAVDITFAE